MSARHTREKGRSELLPNITCAFRPSDLFDRPCFRRVLRPLLFLPVCMYTGEKTFGQYCQNFSFNELAPDLDALKRECFIEFIPAHDFVDWRQTENRAPRAAQSVAFTLQQYDSLLALVGQCRLETTDELAKACCIVDAASHLPTELTGCP
jgi:hypothetical protein